MYKIFLFILIFAAISCAEKDQFVPHFDAEIYYKNIATTPNIDYRFD